MSWEKNSSNLGYLSEMVLDSIVDGVFSVDQKMQIAYWNKGAEKITGFSAEEAIGKACCEVFRANMCGELCPMKNAMKTGIPSGPAEVEIVTKDLEEIRVSVTAAALRNGVGKFLGGVEAFRTIANNQEKNKKVEQTKIQNIEGLISKTPQMTKILSIIPAIAGSDNPVLVLGRSGTGKKTVAKAIHRLSQRISGPFVSVSCTAISDEIRERERLGRSSHTESLLSQARLQAKRGTLLLHEIGDLSPAAQLKMLQILEQKDFRQPQNENDTQETIRVISTTHQNIQKAIREGTFREDLYYRLAVITLELPSLVERKDDILDLAEHFLAHRIPNKNKIHSTLASEVLEILKSHDYPGNIRELENILEHALIVSQSSQITTEDLPSYLVRTTGKLPNSSQMNITSNEDVTDEEVKAALKKNAWNKSRTAKELGIHRSTLWRKIKKLGLKKSSKS